MDQFDGSNIVDLFRTLESAMINQQKDNFSVQLKDDHISINTSLAPPEQLHPFVLNVTTQKPIEYAMITFGYILPFLLVITIIANSLIVIVLAQRHMRTPTNLVLLSMAIADLLTLLFPSPWYIYMYTLGNHNRVLYPPVACYAYHYMEEVIPAVFHNASVWLTLLLAGQRYIYVCHPPLSKTWCTNSAVIRAIIIVYLTAFLSQFSRFFDRRYDGIQFLWNENPTWGCQINTAQWVIEVISENVYFPLYYGFRIIFVNIGPCAALVVLNLLLIRALKSAQRKREILFPEYIKSESRKLRDSNSTPIMLIVVVTEFLLVEIPIAIATLVHVLVNTIITVKDPLFYHYLNAVVLFTSFLGLLSYPVNFAIYCGMSRLFRETFSALFCGRKAGIQTGVSSNWQASGRFSSIFNGEVVMNGLRKYSVVNEMTSVVNGNGRCGNVNANAINSCSCATTSTTKLHSNNITTMTNISNAEETML